MGAQPSGEACSNSCMSGVDFTTTLVSDLCPDCATAELMTLTAKPGAVMRTWQRRKVLPEVRPGSVRVS